MLMLLSMNDEVLWIYSQIVKKIEVIPEAVLSEVSTLIDSVMSKGQEEQKKHSFLDNKGLHKIENGFTINKQPERS